MLLRACEPITMKTVLLACFKWQFVISILCDIQETNYFLAILHRTHIG